MEKIILHIAWTRIYLGVTDKLEYTVTTNSRIEDVGLWRTVINGYPYKSLSELGVLNIDEAFVATKQAVYCYLFENTPDDYEAIGEGGERTLNALKKIVSDAQNSTEMPNLPACKVVAESEEWTEDEDDSSFISKIYSINSKSSHLDYQVVVDGIFPEGSKIIKLDGTETTIFSENEKFKILLPKENLNQCGEFTLNIKTEVKTKPVLYGATPNDEWQNYAITAYMFEDAATTYTDKYPKIEKPKVPEKPIIPEVTKKNEEVKILPITGM